MSRNNTSGSNQNKMNNNKKNNKNTNNNQNSPLPKLQNNTTITKSSLNSNNASSQKVDNNNANTQTKGQKTKAQKEQEEDELIDNKLDKLNLIRKHIPKDGACLFRAIAESIYNKQGDHLKVRQEIVNFLEKNPEEFKNYYASDIPFDHYIFNLKKPDAWGGNLELHAASQIYKTGFIIYTKNAEPLKFDYGFNHYVTLCFCHDNHYDCVYPKEKLQRYTLCQGIVYELIDKALGKKSAWPYAYKNLELEEWQQRRKEQKLQDKTVAQQLSQENDYQKLSGYYDKKDSEGAWENANQKGRKRNKNKNKGQDISRLVLSLNAQKSTQEDDPIRQVELFEFNQKKVSLMLPITNSILN